MPLSTGIPGHPDLAVIRSYPDESCSHRGLGDRGDGAVLDVSFPGDLHRVIGGQVRADLLPVVSSAHRTEENLSSGIDDLTVVRRDVKRRTPVEPIGIFAFLPPGLDVCPDSKFLVDTVMASKLDSVVDPAAIIGINHVVHPIPATERNTVLQSDTPRPALAGDFP
ncbi:hypothetical protein ES703_80234 [subsurface metagenome]